MEAAFFLPVPKDYFQGSKWAPTHGKVDSAPSQTIPSGLAIHEQRQTRSTLATMNLSS